MCTCDRRHFIGESLISLGIAAMAGPALAQAAGDGKKTYVCPPCGCDMDGKQVPAPGACSACGMPLVEYKPPTKDGGGDPRTPSAPAPAPKPPVPTPG